jgi:hypothetical protein
MAFKVTNKNIGRNSRDISYLGKDFESFRNNLMEYAKTYFRVHTTILMKPHLV